MLNFYAKLIEFTILSEHALTQNRSTVVSSISAYELKLENPSWLWLGCLTPIFFFFRIIKYWMFHVIFFKDLLDVEDETKSDEEEEEEEVSIHNNNN